MKDLLLPDALYSDIDSLYQNLIIHSLIFFISASSVVYSNSNIYQKEREKIFNSIAHVLQEAELLEWATEYDELQILYDIMAGKLFYIKQLVDKIILMPEENMLLQDHLMSVKEKYLHGTKLLKLEEKEESIDNQALDILCDELVHVLQNK